MVSQAPTLPIWTWGDLEAALDGFNPRGEENPVRDHLMRGLMDDLESLSPRDFLKQVLSTGWVLAQMGASSGHPASDTPDPRADGAPGF